VPVFEYRCQACGHVMEVLERGRRSEKPVCPQCHGSEMKKLLSGFSVGQSSPSNPAPCGSCPGNPCGAEPCGPGQCPMSF
jgi:putative FmdB family regulatory protein